MDYNDFATWPDHELRDRIMMHVKNMRFWEAKGETVTAANYRALVEGMRVEGRKRGFSLVLMGEEIPRPAKRLPG